MSHEKLQRLITQNFELGGGGGGEVKEVYDGICTSKEFLAFR